MKVLAAQRLSKSQLDALNKALKAARAKANAAYEVDKNVNGKAYEAAMKEVRSLTDKINKATDFGVHTSVDGDITD